MIVGVNGAIVGIVHKVRPHPHGEHIWLADVTLGDDAPPCQIVFGGELQLTGGDLVPVAPKGTEVIERQPYGRERRKKIRARRYRGVRSHGMLCSLDELGWIRGGPNEVAVLRNLSPGQCLDNLPRRLRPKVVVGWQRAKTKARAEKVKEFAARCARFVDWLTERLTVRLATRLAVVWFAAVLVSMLGSGNRGEYWYIMTVGYQTLMNLVVN